MGWVIRGTENLNAGETVALAYAFPVVAMILLVVGWNLFGEPSRKNDKIPD
ncbi:MAG: hypothetical protein AAB439_01235 [Patescibacteria group bacterium]